ncbi:class F sortase [Nocardioides sp.]|uniref:class F sortase n=1 Tax=Nocardioides sp. TaxID=35761 RepID=UPI00286CFF06|nr:class F sortase [Nocardioides sp.]
MALVGGGLAVFLTQTPQVVEQEPTSGAASSPVAQAASAATTPEATRAPWKPGAPRTLRIPALDVEAPVVPVKAPGGTLTPPSDPQQLGWWADGARPGERQGSVLVAGHTVHNGGGALDDLEQLEVGDPVTVATQGANAADLAYVVTSVRIYGKGQLARHAATIFAQDVPGRLVVVTCEDWNGSDYLSNVVVVARPRT